VRLIYPPSAKSDDLTAMLRTLAPDWTPAKLRELILSGKLPEDFIDGAAHYIAGKPHLWTVSDEEFIAAVALVNPACAEVFRTPQGLAFMHAMSQKLMCRVPLIALGLSGRRRSHGD
jgi:hypothetical protein